MRDNHGWLSTNKAWGKTIYPYRRGIGREHDTMKITTNKVPRFILTEIGAFFVIFAEM